LMWYYVERKHVGWKISRWKLCLKYMINFSLNLSQYQPTLYCTSLSTAVPPSLLTMAQNSHSVPTNCTALHCHTTNGVSRSLVNMATPTLSCKYCFYWSIMNISELREKHSWS